MVVKKENEDGMVSIRLFSDNGRYKGDLFVSVNGKNYLLPRGKKSKVPPEIAEEIRRANEAEEMMDAHIDEMLKASK